MSRTACRPGSRGLDPVVVARVVRDVHRRFDDHLTRSPAHHHPTPAAGGTPNNPPITNRFRPSPHCIT
jgi:hypothetical protein